MARGSGSWVYSAVARGERVDAIPFRNFIWALAMERRLTYADLARRWDVDYDWIRSITSGKRRTVDVARLDAIMVQEGLTLTLLQDRYREVQGLATLSLARKRLPAERSSRTVRVAIDAIEGQFEMYVTAGEYEDGRLAEVFVKLGSKGEAYEALMDQWAIGLSVAIQCGADFEELCRKYALRKFEPSGRTNDPDIPYAFSPTDYIVRWLALRYGSVRLISELSEEAVARQP